MSKRDKLLSKLADRRNDKNQRYEEVKALLIHYGYTLRHEGGSHAYFIITESPRGLTLTLDRKGLMPFYQVRQVREELQRAGILYK